MLGVKLVISIGESIDLTSLNFMKKQYSYFKFNGIDTQFKYQIDTVDNKRQKRLLKTAINKALKVLNYKSLEQLYNDLYNNEICICGFCNKNPIHVEFEYNVDNNHILNLTYQQPIKFLCDSYECKQIRKQLNPNSIKFVSIAYKLTEEQANKYIIERNNSEFYFHQDRETYEEYKARQSRDINFFINRYGEEEGVKRYNNVITKISYSCSREGLANKYGEEKADQICQSKAITLDKMIEIYGEEEGPLRFENWKKEATYAASYAGILEHYGLEAAEEHKKKVSYNMSYDGMVERLGKETADQKIENWRLKSSKKYKQSILNEDDFNKWRKSLAVNTLEYYINKFGEKDGEKMFIERMDKYFASRHLIINDSRSGKYIDSKQAYEFFKLLENQILSNFKQIKDEDIFYANGNNKNEYRIDYIENGKLRWFKLDFCIPKYKFNVEFDGAYYHPIIDASDEYI